MALDRIDEVKPDLILLDVMMPRLDGIETLKMLRERSVNTPVVMLTATNTVKTAVQAMRFGAVDYLNKPLISLNLRVSLYRPSVMTLFRLRKQPRRSLLTDLSLRHQKVTLVQ